MTIRAAIFDLDGVLIDTEYLAFKAWQKTLHGWNHELEDADFPAMMGLDANQTVNYIHQRTAIPMGDAVLLAEHDRLMLSVLDGELQPLPGASDLIADLVKRGLPLAIASNSTQEYIDRALKCLHLDHFFNVIASRDAVRAGKPAPDVYQAAAARLGIPPAQCLAFEDSRVGVRSAVSADTRCVAIPGPIASAADFSTAFAMYSSIPAAHADLDRLLA